MVDFKDFDESKLPDYTIDDLRGFINEIEIRRSVLSEKCSSEMAVYLQNESFDIYSFRGSRKIKKIANKYAHLFAAGDEFLRIIGDELRRREQYEEEMRYSGKSVNNPKKYETEEEFLQREQDKTDVYRSKID